MLPKPGPLVGECAMCVRWVHDGQIILLGSTKMKPDPKTDFSLSCSCGPLIIPTKRKTKTTEDAPLEDKDATQKELHSNVLGSAQESSGVLKQKTQSELLTGESCLATKGKNQTSTEATESHTA